MRWPFFALTSSQIGNISLPFVILLQVINNVTDVQHYFLSCRKEGNISSINRAIGLHCGCEINVWPWGKNAYFLQILILSISLIFPFAVNLPSCSIFFLILQHISFYFNAFLFLLLKTVFIFIDHICCSALFSSSSRTLNPRRACLLFHRQPAFIGPLGAMQSCIFSSHVFCEPPSPLLFLMACSIGSRKNKNFIIFQGLVSLHYCWLKKYPKKPMHTFTSILPLSVLLIWTWRFSKFSFSMFAVCLFLEWSLSKQSF